jgi:(2S)-methylsuccinyl-CoA dehydrogenase
MSDHLVEIRQSVRSFVEGEILPIATKLDRQRAEIPMPVIHKMSELGYLGLTIPTEYGGAGMDHESLCIVTEELCRGWLSVGSVMTRNLISGTLILANGTEEQKRRWLPGLAAGKILSAAAFTEPNHGSDTASFETRATYDAEKKRYLVNGQKIWITMANRAHVLSTLCRTNPDPAAKHKGLSILLIEKEPGDRFRPPEISGEEIPSIGYHGLHCYSLGFEDCPVPAENLLGGEPGKGFYQLMSTYESARIQTAARAVGVAQAAMDASLRYSRERTQFGKPIGEHQVIKHKLAEMASRLEAGRQLTYHAARMKDLGKRCDLEAGMAKVIATEMVEFVTRECIQIHGGYGYSEEFDAQRFWRDGKLFSVFEGTSEIQLEVIGRRLLERS